MCLWKAEHRSNENIESESVISNKESAEIGLANILDEINTDIQPGAARTYMNSMQVVFSQKLSSVYDAYQELLGSHDEELLASAGGDMSGYP